MDIKIGHIFFPDKPNEIHQSVRLIINDSIIQLEVPIYFKSLVHIEIILGAFNGIGDATFINCSYAGMESGVGAHITKFNVQYLLKGVHILSTKDLFFQKASINIPDLHEWYGQSILKKQCTKDNISLAIPEKYLCEISDEFDLELFISIHRAYKSAELLIKESTCLKVVSKSGKLSVLRFIEIIDAFKKFLLFTTYYNIKTEWLHFYDKDKSEISIELLFNPFDVNSNNSSYASCLHFNNIKGNIQNILKKWYLDKELYTSIDLILEKSINTRLSQENYFLNVCFSIETFHRKFKNYRPFAKKKITDIKKRISAVIDDISIQKLIDDKLAHMNEPSFKDRLLYFYNDFEKILCEETSTKDFITKVVKTRNYLVHGALQSKTLKGLEIFLAADYIDTVIRVNIYREIGVDEIEIDNILLKSKDYFLSIKNSFKDEHGDELINY